MPDAFLSMDDALTPDEARDDLTKPVNGRKVKKTTPEMSSIHARLPVDLVTQLRLARAHDGVSAIARIRALVQLWADDPFIRDKADKLAREL